MANLNLTPNELPQALTPLGQNDYIIVQQGIGGIVAKTTPTELVDSVSPVSTQGEAQAGIDNLNRMTPLRTKESIASEIGVSIASSAQGNLATTSVQPSRSLNTGTGLSGGGDLSSDRTLSLNPASIASLLKADTAVQSVNGKSGTAVTIVKGDVGLGNVDNTSDASKPISTATQTALNAKADSSVTVTAGSGLTGGGNLTANRTVSLNASSIASLAKADTAIQAPGGATGQVLTKNSATTNDVSWQTVAAATAVSYAPQTLNSAQQLQARQNIGATSLGSALFTSASVTQAQTNLGITSYIAPFLAAINQDTALATILASPRPSQTGRGLFQAIQTSTGGSAVLPAGGSYAFWVFAYDAATGQIRNGFSAGVSAGGSTIGNSVSGWIWSGVYWNLT